jgi:hypothetical protein
MGGLATAFEISPLVLREKLKGVVAFQMSPHACHH